MALDIRSVSGTSFQSDTKLTTKKESTSDAPSFQTSLDALQQKKLESLSFSKHAAKRMDERNIPMNDSLLGNLEHAVSEARKRVQRTSLSSGGRAYLSSMSRTMSSSPRCQRTI